MAQAIEPTDETQMFARQFQRYLLSGAFFLVLPNLFMQSAAGIDGSIGHANLLDLLQIEESLAIGQGMQGHDPDKGFGG